MQRSKLKAKDIARYGLMLALALVLSWVETLIPFAFPLPGMKIGLANIVIVTMLYAAGPKRAALISFLRLLLVMITFGNASAFLYSLAGAALSFAVMCLLKKSECLMLQRAAFGILRSNIQEADTRRADVHQFTGVKAAHIGKLEQILRGAFYICTAVDQHNAIFSRRKNRRQCRAANAPNALYRQCRAGKQRSGAAGRDNSISFPF